MKVGLHRAEISSRTFELSFRAEILNLTFEPSLSSIQPYLKVKISRIFDTKKYPDKYNPDQGKSKVYYTITALVIRVERARASFVENL